VGAWAVPPGGGGSVPNDLVTNGGTVDVVIDSESGTFYSAAAQMSQLRLTNASQSSLPIVRFNSETNSQGEAAVEIEATTNGNTSPVTLRGAGGLNLVANTITANNINNSGTNTVNILSISNAVGNGWGFTNLNTFDSLVPTFTGTGFWLGTNSAIICSSNIYIISLINTPSTGIERCGQLTIRATGDITVTNFTAGGVTTSDMVSTRTLTNGNTMVIATDVIPGVSTNIAVVQFH
jgi:hypothetical protein